MAIWTPYRRTGMIQVFPRSSLVQKQIIGAQQIETLRLSQLSDVLLGFGPHPFTGFRGAMRLLHLDHKIDAVWFNIAKDGVEEQLEQVS